MFAKRNPITGLDKICNGIALTFYLLSLDSTNAPYSSLSAYRSYQMNKRAKPRNRNLKKQ
jgi:hypothetical protein